MRYKAGDFAVNKKTAEVVKVLRVEIVENGIPTHYRVVTGIGDAVVHAEDLKPGGDSNPKEEIIPSFADLCELMVETYVRKNADYGNSFDKSIDHYGNVAFLTRASDKFNRAENLLMGKEQQVADEKVTDTLMDLANYCVMMVAYLKKNKNKK